jgi:asparagine synthase (glutamine-hydrolysing)
MCGICGVFGYRDGAPASEHEVRAMADAIAHRGPDGEGYFVDGAVGLGHRRLSIIDLSAAGAQPMHSASGRYVIVFNGEIYNYLELRQQLAASGVRFQSHSDTEVLLQLFERDGPDCVHKLNGMFAFAVWA